MDSWLYIDSNSVQKGPIPEPIILKLLEKGIVSDQTPVWKIGLEKWQNMSDIEPFKTQCNFISKLWYFVDSQNETKGPVITR